MLHTTAAAGDVDDDDDDDDYDSDNDNSDSNDNVDVVVDNSTSALAARGGDEAPEDLHAFFVHPLTAAASRQTGDGDAMALLHEYRNLPLIDVHLAANAKYEQHTTIVQGRSDGGV